MRHPVVVDKPILSQGCALRIQGALIIRGLFTIDIWGGGGSIRRDGDLLSEFHCIDLCCIFSLVLFPF